MELSEKNNKLIYLYLLILFIVNGFQGGLVELSYDEAYYWMYSQFLSFGYFDHPPMVGWLIKIGYTLFENEFGVRLLFNILSVGSLFLAWQMTKKDKPFLFILMSLSYPLIQSSGFLALPDTPLLFFATLFLFLIRKYIENDSYKLSVLIALVISLLFYSKYHGLLVVILTLLANLSFIRRKSFWLIVTLAVFFYLPHMIWQYQHDFISFVFHLTGRVEKHFEFGNILNYLTSQIALFGFLNFFFFIYLLKQVNLKDVWNRILFFNTSGFLVLLFFMSFRNQIEANWTVTACLASLVLFHRVLENKKHTKVLSILSIFPVILIIVLRVVLILPSSFYADKDIGRLNEIKGWDVRIEKLKEIVGNKKIVAETYQYGAKVSFHLKKMIPVRHFKGRDSHYRILNLTESLDKNEEIFYLTPRKVEGAVRIETGYKDPLYVLKTTLSELEAEYGNI